MNAQELWAEYQPKLDAAKEQDRKDSQEVFLDAPEKVGSIWLCPLSIKKYLMLDAISHPFLSGDELTEEHIYTFCWVLSVDFTERNPQAYKNFKESLRMDNAEAFVIDVRLFFESQLNFSDSDSESTSQNSDWVGIVIDLLASEYGWSEDQILNLPVKRALTYSKHIAHRKSGASLNWQQNADRVKAEFIEEMSKLEGNKDE